MNLQHRRLISRSLILATSLMSVPAICGAQLLPPGDFNGKSLNQWGFDFTAWALATGMGGQSLPNTVDGARYLPPNFGGGDITANVTIQQGTALVVTPFFVFGENYDNGGSDNPADPVLDAIFADATIRSAVDGSTVLEGLASSFPDRKFGPTSFPAPIVYAAPQSRGPGLNSTAAVFSLGITTIFDGLTLGPHTIKNEFSSPNFFGSASFTYNISVVPEPASVLPAAIGALGVLRVRRRRAQCWT